MSSLVFSPEDKAALEALREDLEAEVPFLPLADYFTSIGFWNWMSHSFFFDWKSLNLSWRVTILIST
jgi:hypothetical protein